MHELWYSFCRFLTLLALVVIVGAGAPASAQQSGRFVDRTFSDRAGDHKYVVFLPAGYSAARKWPAILYLHSAGERGTDGRRPTLTGLGAAVRAQTDTFPFVVVFPQAEDESGRRLTGWSADSLDGKRAIQILNAVEQEFAIDRDRVILTGWSMGGYGAWSIGAAMPERFAAVVPLAGGGDPASAGRLKAVPIWAWQGAKDTAVFPAEAQRMAEAVRSAGGVVHYTEAPQVGHDIWRAAYGHGALYAWMLDPSAEPAATVIDSRELIDVERGQPFVPALHIPGAIRLRLGNQALQALGYSIPGRVPQTALRGGIRNIYDTTTASGRTFRVTLSRISYQAQLVRATLKARSVGQLSVQLGLRNVVLSIGSASMVGSGRSATTGPMSVVIGNRRPAWLSMIVAPYVADRRVGLRLVSADFRIENDNWYVTRPYGIRVSGFGMTRERVSSGLVSGLYGSKSRIESEVVAAIPAMLRELETNLDLSPVDGVVGSIWPLPVYRPRLRTWPQGVTTDEHGITLTMGITAAAIDPSQSPADARTVSLTDSSPDATDKSDALRVGLNPQLLGPLIDLLRDAGVARIHVLDIPEGTFAALADRSLLDQAIPDLRGFGEDVDIWSELKLESPLQVMADGTEAPELVDIEPNVHATVAGDTPHGIPAGSKSSSTRLRFEIPRAVISLAVRKDPDQEWTRVADFEFRVAQAAVAQVYRPDFTRRALRLDWTGEPELDVTAHFAADYRPDDSSLDVAVVREALLRSWKAWTSTAPLTDVALGDVDFGSSKLRPNQIRWHGSNLSISFDPAGIRITNDTRQVLEYETKGPHSGWGGPYSLEPGGFHQFEVPYPVLYRHRTDAGVVNFTLPSGSHSEYRVLDPEGAPSLFQARTALSDGKSTDPSEVAP